MEINKYLISKTKSRKRLQFLQIIPSDDDVGKSNWYLCDTKKSYENENRLSLKEI